MTSYLDYIQTALQLNKDNFVKAYDKSMDFKEEEKGALEDVRFQCIQDDFDRLMEDYRLMKLKVNELHDNYNDLMLDEESFFNRIDELKKEYRQAVENEKKS